MCTNYFLEAMNLMFVQDEGSLGCSYSLPTTRSTSDVNDTLFATSPSPVTQFPPTPDSSTPKFEAASRTSSRAGTPKLRVTSKRTLQDVFAEESAKDHDALERLGKQKHERAIGEQELKRRRLENKAMIQQHQREREREQHEFRMLQLRVMASRTQASLGVPSQNPSSLEGFGLMAELNAPALPSESSSLTQYPL
jgi:hypothetical protein